jgi:hypothetical protein
LVLRRPGGKLAAEIGPFDPASWILDIGNPGEVVDVRLLVAVDHLLAALDDDRRATVRVRVSGELDNEAAAALERLAAGSSRPVPSRPVAAAPPVGNALPAPERPAVTAGNPAPRPAAVPPAVAAKNPPLALPPVVTATKPPVPVVPVAPRKPSPALAVPSAMMSGAPIATVSEPRRRTEDQDTAGGPAETSVAEPEAPRAAPVERGLTDREPVEDPLAGTPGSEPEPVAPGPVEDNGPVAPLVLAARASTTAEQNRFTSGAGEAFNQALATVNAALAAWPSMRQQGSTPGAKADYVAVCLYLGRGEAGGAELNEAVRAGLKGGVDGQIPCLVSGLRRLPTHRRAVLRQGRIEDSLEHGTAPGALLAEPGFLSASMELDVTLPGTDLDVLIWPATARRTSELVVSRPISEVVFAAGARFKALAVRTAEAVSSDEEEEDGVAAPRTAALFRELAPGEETTTELNENDLRVLEKLDRVLAHRRKAELRLVDDAGIASRMTGSMVEWQATVQQLAVAASR